MNEEIFPKALVPVCVLLLLILLGIAVVINVNLDPYKNSRLKCESIPCTEKECLIWDDSLKRCGTFSALSQLKGTLSALSQCEKLKDSIDILNSKIFQQQTELENVNNEKIFENEQFKKCEFRYTYLELHCKNLQWYQNICSLSKENCGCYECWY